MSSIYIQRKIRPGEGRGTAFASRGFAYILLARLKELSLAKIKDYSQSVAAHTTVWNFCPLYLLRLISVIFHQLYWGRSVFSGGSFWALGTRDLLPHFTRVIHGNFLARRARIPGRCVWGSGNKLSEKMIFLLKCENCNIVTMPGLSYLGSLILTYTIVCVSEVAKGR